MLKRLKYFSIHILMGGPNLQMINPTRKNLADRLIADARTKVGKSILNAPAAKVKILYGKGVKPAAATAQP